MRRPSPVTPFDYTIPFDRTDLTDDMKEYMEHYYGWGDYNARYWFFGMEPGGAGLHLLFLAIWQHLGKTALHDFALHCKLQADLPGVPDFCSPTAPLQDTFGPLMWFLLGYQLGRDLSNEEVLAYQREKWGRHRGDTALLELSALPSGGANTKTIPNWARQLFLSERLAHLKQKLRVHKPELAVFYSKTYLKAWREITGVQLEPYQPERVGPTLCLVTDHPTYRFNQRLKALNDWSAEGQRMAQLQTTLKAA